MVSGRTHRTESICGEPPAAARGNSSVDYFIFQDESLSKKIDAKCLRFMLKKSGAVGFNALIF